MALKVGADFKQRWCATPETVRQIFQEDLQRICQLLEPDSDLNRWQQQDHNAQQMAPLRINKAYAQLKAERIEQARIRKQYALEQALAQNRAKQAAYTAALEASENAQFSEQTKVLQQLNANLRYEIDAQMARYQPNPTAQNLPIMPTSTPEQHDLKQLLHTEAEKMIEQAVTVFRARLHRVASEKIDNMLE